MTEGQKETVPIEQKIAVVDAWISSVKVNEDAIESPELHDPDVPSTEFVTVPEIEPELLREVLTHFGADFDDAHERGPALKTLRKETNAGRKDGMDAVWGDEFMHAFKAWTTTWADDYEERTDKKLPTVKTRSGKRVKTSGMRQFFGEMTACASDAMEVDTFRLHVAGRVLNGHLGAQNKEKKKLNKERHRENINYPSSIPPGYMEDLWDALKSGEFSVGKR